MVRARPIGASLVQQQEQQQAEVWYQRPAGPLAKAALIGDRPPLSEALCSLHPSLRCPIALQMATSQTRSLQPMLGEILATAAWLE